MRPSVRMTRINSCIAKRLHVDLHGQKFISKNGSYRNTNNNFITARKQSLGQGNVFTPVCLFTGGWLPSIHHRSHCHGGLHSGGLHRGGQHPRDTSGNGQ